MSKLIEAVEALKRGVSWYFAEQYETVRLDEVLAVIRQHKADEKAAESERERKRHWLICTNPFCSCKRSEDSRQAHACAATADAAVPSTPLGDIS